MIASSVHLEHVGVFDRNHRMLTIGLILGVTLIAFEALAVVTIAPRFAASLGGIALYGWVFSAYLLASLLGAVVAGQLADRRGPALAFLLGLILFAGGSILNGLAPAMGVLILGRALQGFGGGALATAMYVVVNLAYSDAQRPRMMALMSSAWVVPALIGPAGAGLVAETLSWRWVFLGVAPLLLVTALLTVPAFGRIHSSRRPAADTGRLRNAVGLVIGTGLVLAGFEAAGPWLSLPMLAVGAALVVLTLARLTPAGTLRFARGLPAVVATRGLFYAAFAGVEVFLALMLTSVHGYSSAVTGLAIATGAVSWTAGSWLQDRWDGRSSGRGRPARVVAGTIVLSVGLAAQLAALYAPTGPVGFTIAGWLLAGLGIGLAHSTSSVLAFGFASEGEEGAVSSSLQLADQFASAVSTGGGGALFALALALGLAEREGVLLALSLNLALVALGVLAASRIAGGDRRGPIRVES